MKELCKNARGQLEMIMNLSRNDCKIPAIHKQMPDILCLIRGSQRSISNPPDLTAPY